MTRLPVISQLGWSREGTLTYQQSRLRLVRILDSLIQDLGQSVQAPPVLIDGQTLPLEDYLEVRPLQQAAVSQLVQEGRLLLGPWYTIPEEFLVSPESMVRNLLIGRQMAEAYGRYFPVSVNLRASGHIRQMPQILTGFGIKTATVESDAQDTPPESIWMSPDGSAVLLLNIGSHTESGAFSNVLLNPEIAVDSLSANISVDEYLEELEQHRRGLPVIRNELREAEHRQGFTGITTSRMWLKLLNHTIESELAVWTEPTGAWLSLIDKENVSPTHDLVRHAWANLIVNQHPDVLGGSAIDGVYDDVRNRLTNAEQLSGEISIMHLTQLADAVDSTLLGESQPLGILTVFNGATVSQTGVASFEVYLDPDVKSVSIVDETGEETSCYIYPIDDGSDALPYIQFIATDIPAMGYRTYALQERKEPPGDYNEDGTFIENEYLQVDLDREKGSLSVTDKRTGHVFDGLNQFIDEGDAGDTRTYHPPSRDTVIGVPSNTPLRVQRHIGPTGQLLQVLQIYRLPGGLVEDRSGRLLLAAQYVPVSILTTVHLLPGVPRLDVETHISNTAQDHRLRVVFPTGLDADYAYYDGHYEVIRRPVSALRGKSEKPIGEHQRSFVTVMNDKIGLTIANRGLPESAVYTTPDGVTISLTLMRAVGWAHRDDLGIQSPNSQSPYEVPQAQERIENSYYFSIIPHGKDLQGAWTQARAFQTVLRTVVHQESSPGRLPMSAALIDVDNPNFVISSIKIADAMDGVIVRGYNTSSQVQTVNLTSDFVKGRAEVVRLDETATGDKVSRRRKDKAYRFQAKPHEVVSLLFRY